MAHEKKHELHSGGNCICPKCETKVGHKAGMPCSEEICPKCGAKMLREGSEHHLAFLEKKNKKK
jgi:hypothetical protein